VLITNHFVVLNFPKTGSTFVREVIKEIYNQRLNKKLIDRFLIKLKIKDRELIEELLLPNYGIANNKDRKSQHGAYFQIPEIHRNKKIISILRNPYSRFESQYKFKAWARNVILDATDLNKFPQFPDLTIEDYFEYQICIADNQKKIFGIPKGLNIGSQTIRFIYMFFKNPLEIFPKLTAEYFEKRNYLQDIAEIEFLKQETLNDELALFLSKYDFSNDELNFVRNYKKVNVTDSQKILMVPF